jgi:hypothetical protein
MFKILSKLAAGAILLLALAGCQSAYISNGPLTASKALTTYYMNFKKDPNADYMVTSPDGKYANYSYCPAQRCGGNAQALVIQACSKEAGEPCYLLGSRNTLLWHYADNIPGDDLARTLCFAALVDDEDIRQYLMATTARSVSNAGRDCQAAARAIRNGDANATDEAAEERGLTGHYQVGADHDGYRPVSGWIEVLGFKSEIHGWLSVHKDDTAKVDLYQPTSGGGVGPLLGLAYIPR